MNRYGSGRYGGRGGFFGHVNGAHGVRVISGAVNKQTRHRPIYHPRPCYALQAIFLNRCNASVKSYLQNISLCLYNASLNIYVLLQKVEQMQNNNDK